MTTNILPEGQPDSSAQWASAFGALLGIAVRSVFSKGNLEPTNEVNYEQVVVEVRLHRDCNCAHGCSCNLTMIPTDGTCQAVDAWKIREGAFDNTRLDGLGIAIIVRWPNPIHRGNGRCVVFIDELADDAQRKSLSEIGTGNAGQGGAAIAALIWPSAFPGLLR